ncbi:MAG: hypothetical protein RLY93_03025 [Sumerlaeia bacterium]
MNSNQTTTPRFFGLFRKVFKTPDGDHVHVPGEPHVEGEDKKDPLAEQKVAKQDAAKKSSVE